MKHLQPRSFRRRALAALAALLACGFATAEFASRHLLGLGDPPLYVSDSSIEYMLRPDQDVRRFGHRIVVNHWGMRSLPFSSTRTSADELRVLVFGDSVINGGSQTDHEQLATTLLANRLTIELGRPTIVGNVSAGSWGPGNWLAYMERYGSFDADVVVVVLNSGDAADNPTFQALDPQTHPTRKPWLALQEGWSRYLPRYLPALLSSATSVPVATEPTAADMQRGLSDLEAFFSKAKAGGASLLVLHHPDAREAVTGRYEAGKDQEQALCSRLQVPFIEMRADYARAGAATLYRDDIHLEARGQGVIAAIALRELAARLR